MISDHHFPHQEDENHIYFNIMGNHLPFAHTLSGLDHYFYMHNLFDSLKPWKAKIDLMLIV